VRGNGAPLAGALLLHETSARVVDCAVEENAATAGDGGGLWMLGTQALRVDGSTFARNSAIGSGAAIFVWGAEADLRRTRFLSNQAHVRGGAVYCGLGSVVMTSCATLNDRALLEGGGVYAWGAPSVQLVNLTALDGAPQAVFLWDAIGRVDNSLLWDSGAAPLFVGGASAVAVSWSLVQGGYSGPGNLSTPPMLASPQGADGLPGTGDEDLAPLQGSPCVDAGDSAALPPFATHDLVGAPRRRDDPQAPNTGVGPAPIVDIGARER
jgi:predicted outer membrane repeat protein